MQMQSYLDSISKKWKRRWYRIGVVVASFGAILTLRKVLDVVYRRYHKYPPGPLGVPVFGSLFSAIDLPKYISYLASNYGPITMIYIGKQPFVFLYRLEDIREIFNNEDALDRDVSSVYHFLKPHEINTGFVPFKYWHKKRKRFQSIMLSHLDSSLLNRVHNAALKEHVFAHMDSCIAQNKAWYPSTDVSDISFNFMWFAAFGSPVSFDSKGRKLIDTIKELIKQLGIDLGKDLLLKYLGIVKLIPANMIQYNAWEHLTDCVEQQIYTQLNYNENVFDMNDTTWNQHFDEIRHATDSCLVSKFIAAHRKNPDALTSSKNAIMQDILLLFAGVDVMSSAIEYGMVLIAKFPAYQQRIYNELYNVFGDDVWMQKCEFRHEIHKLHHLRAFVHEVLRISRLSPIGVPHYNSNKEVWFENKRYCIPKQTLIFGVSNLNDPYWSKKIKGNPLDLCLELWLDDNHHFKSNLNPDKIVSFGLGPRECAAKAFAIRGLYLIFAKFILSYQLLMQKGNENMKIKQVFEFVMRIRPEIGLIIKHR